MSTDYINFAARSGGSNMNAGTLTGDTTVPGTSATKTYTGGDSAANAASFTAVGGSDMTEAVAGRYACLFIDGDTTPTTGQYVLAKITSVVGTVINLSTTERATFGTVLGSGSGNRSLKIGGAWAGPSGANHVPLTLAVSNLSSTKPVRINLKNDVTYSITANLSINGSGCCTNLRGFTTTYGDGGRATIDGGTSGSAYILVTYGGSGEINHTQEIIFNHNGASSDAQLVQISSGGVFFKGCVFANSRGNGVSNSSNCTLTECEVYGNNASNSETAGVANFGTIFMNRCTIHDNAGSGTNGVRNTGNCFMVECVVDTNGKHGVESVGSSSHCALIRCDVYNNASTGLTATAASTLVDSCNFVKNTGTGIAGPTAGGINCYTISCAIGTGTQANASSSTNYVVEESQASLTANTTPWTDPANGDFSIASGSAAIAAGRGTFTSTASGWGTTAGSPCRSAAQRSATPPATDYPSANDVRSGTSFNFGAATGNATFPAAADVESGVQYGTSGTQYTGTFTKPAVGDVESGVQYGGGGTEFTGTFAVPAQSNVKNTIQYGAGGTEFTGTYVPASTGGCPLVGHGGLVL